MRNSSETENCSNSGIDDLDMGVKEFRKVIKTEIKNFDAQLAFKRASESFRRNLENVIRKYPQTMDLIEEVRKVKEDSITNLKNLVEITIENMEANGIKVIFAKTAADAREAILEELGFSEDGKGIVAKSKSMTLEEIGLREFLEMNGFEVWETDLGEFIIQLTGDRPMHLTSPAIHISKETIAKLINERINNSGEIDSIDSIVKAVRIFLRDKLINAKAGISGSNVISAETGSLMIIENEGNARLTTGLPRKHIAVVGIEKIVPRLSDAYRVAELTWRFAGYGMPSYFEVISSPSKTGDIEKKIVMGAHGPEELTVVLLDNGRLKASRDEVLREALKCLRCGACMYECPVFSELRGNWGEVYMGGIGVLWSAIIGSKFAHLAMACLLCSRCGEICPAGIDAGKLIREIRKRVIAEFKNM
jgi:L-lactate dehydrogenase complex protein LldG